MNDRGVGDYPKFWTNSLRMKFRLIPSGTFQMGSPLNEFRRFADETPHQVVLTQDFYLSVYLTTQAQWRALLGENPSKCSDLKEAPVESVSWFDCQNFIEKLNEEEYGSELSKFLGEEWRYSLPTEAQWEYVCRAGTVSTYYVGNSVSEADGNFGKNVADSSKITDCADPSQLCKTISPVGAFAPNPWEFYDMIGNVCEWTLDGYTDYPIETCEDPVGISQTSERVARGGSWRSVAENCRSASRFNFLPTYRADNCGLRVAIVRKS